MFGSSNNSLRQSRQRRGSASDEAATTPTASDSSRHTPPRTSPSRSGATGFLPRPGSPTSGLTQNGTLEVHIPQWTPPTAHPDDPQQAGWCYHHPPYDKVQPTAADPGHLSSSYLAPDCFTQYHIRCAPDAQPACGAPRPSRDHHHPLHRLQPAHGHDSMPGVCHSNSGSPYSQRAAAGCARHSWSGNTAVILPSDALQQHFAAHASSAMPSGAEHHLPSGFTFSSLHGYTADRACTPAQLQAMALTPGPYGPVPLYGSSSFAGVPPPPRPWPASGTLSAGPTMTRLGLTVQLPLHRVSDEEDDEDHPTIVTVKGGRVPGSWADSDPPPLQPPHGLLSARRGVAVAAAYDAAQGGSGGGGAAAGGGAFPALAAAPTAAAALLVALALLGVAWHDSAPGAVALLITCWLQACWALMGAEARTGVRLGQAAAALAGVLALRPGQGAAALLAETRQGASTLQQLQACLLVVLPSLWLVQVLACRLADTANASAAAAAMRALAAGKSHPDVRVLSDDATTVAGQGCCSGGTCVGLPLPGGRVAAALQRALLCGACLAQLAAALLLVAAAPPGPLEWAAPSSRPGPATPSRRLDSAAGTAARTLLLLVTMAAPLLVQRGAPAGGAGAAPTLLLRPSSSAALRAAVWDARLSRLLFSVAAGVLYGWAQGAYVWQLLQVGTVVLGLWLLYKEGVRSQRVHCSETKCLLPLSPANGAGSGGGVAVADDVDLVKVPLLLPHLHHRGDLTSRLVGGGLSSGPASACDTTTLPGSPSSVASAGSSSCGGTVASAGGASVTTAASSSCAGGSGAALPPSRGASGSGCCCCCSGCFAPAAGGGSGCGLLGSAALACTPWSQLLLALAAATSFSWLLLMTDPLAPLGDGPADTFLGLLAGAGEEAVEGMEGSGDGPLEALVLPLLAGTGLALALLAVAALRAAARGELSLRLRTDRTERRRLQVYAWAGGLAVAVAVASCVSWALAGEDEEEGGRGAGAYAAAEAVRCLGIWPLAWLMEPWLVAGVEVVGGCDSHAGCGLTCHVLRWARVRRAGRPGAAGGGGKAAASSAPLSSAAAAAAGWVASGGGGVRGRVRIADVEAGGKQQRLVPALVN